jgi:hypothetical protein
MPVGTQGYDEVPPMSNSPIRRDGPSTSAPASRVQRLAGTALDRLPSLTDAVAGPARAMAFWTAVALPVLNLALLARGLSTPGETATFVVLLVCNLLALVVGHPYRRD